MVYLEHVVLTVTLTLEGYDVAYKESDFYDAYSYYYPESDKNGEGFADFEFDEGVGRDVSYAETYSSTFRQWLEAPHPRRGDIQVELTSPRGTTSVLLPYRRYDFVNSEGYSEWPFMSVHFWGEDPIGDWSVNIHYISSSGYVSAFVHSLKLFGTLTIPESVGAIPTACDPLCSDGCAGAGTRMCDACSAARNQSSLECVSSCGVNDTLYDGYCIDSYRGSRPPVSCYYNVVLVVVVVFLVLFALVVVIVISVGVVAGWFWKRRNEIFSRWKRRQSYSGQGPATLHRLLYKFHTF